MSRVNNGIDRVYPIDYMYQQMQKKDDLIDNNLYEIYEKLDANDSLLADIAANVKSFGAKGDGVTDDTQAIVNAITATNGRKLYFPKGAYMVSSTINFTCSVIFEDSLSTYLIPKTGATISPVVKIDNQVFKSYINVSVSRDSRDTVNHDGIQISGYSNRIHVSNMRTTNLNGHGIKIDAVWDSHFEKLHVESCGSVEFSKEGLWIGASSDTVNQNTFISIQTEKCFKGGLWVTDQAYSNRFIGIHAEWNAPTTGNHLRLGGYRNQYYGSGHLGANYEKVYVGGENNVYDGIFFDNAIVEGTDFSNGYTHKMVNCTISEYRQLGGSLANFLNCDIITLVLNGNGVKANGGTIGTVTHTFTSNTYKCSFYSVEIDSITQNGVDSNNLQLVNCTVKNAVNFSGRGIKLVGTSFDSLVTFGYVDGINNIRNNRFKAGFTQYGNNSIYKILFFFCEFDGNVSFEANNASELHHCSIIGSVTGDASSKLIKSYVSGTTGALTIVA